MSIFHLDKDWKELLHSELVDENFQRIIKFYNSELESGKTIYPATENVFKAFNDTKFQDTKVVLLGQDPYHRAGQAMGLSFSVPGEVKIPPSLRNIFIELQADLGYQIPSHGDLSLWAKEGVLLLNSVLTVEQSLAGSHRGKGWEKFTDEVIRLLSEQKENLVFLLWGNFAKSKSSLIDPSRHLILEAAHPSPLARGAFFGSRPFSRTNAYLISNNISPINWNIV